MKNTAHNIYIHVPFCASKCNYCAFFSRACKNPDWGKYTTAICDEINLWAQKLGKIDIPTIFLGGGTPSLMPTGAVKKILDTIATNFNASQTAEITMESNPGTLTADKLRDLKTIGINRLSVGVQSLDDDRLKFLGRKHTVADAIRLLTAAQDLGLRVSADFIYGLPNDTEQDIIKMCQQINNLGLRHCSLYELTIEQNTPFGKINLEMPDNDTMAQMYTAIANTLALPRYEVSNYATPDNECKHNQNVWDGEPYIGIGNGAAGRILMANAWYEQTGGDISMQPMSDSTRAIEKIITGMRTIRGCQLTEAVKNAIDIDWVKNNPNLVQIKDNRISATGQGLLILDEVIVNLVK